MTRPQDLSVKHGSQSAILEAPGPAGYSIELDLTAGDPREALDRLVRGLGMEPGVSPSRAANAVLGIGAPLVAAMGASLPGLRSFETLTARATLPAAQHGAWVFFSAESTGAAFERAETILAAASPMLRVVEQTPLFRYRTSHDLTGYEDGLANPVGEAAAQAAIVGEGALAGSSFAFVQRFVHDRAGLWRLSAAEQDNVIGRSKSDGHELADAPESAHVKRTEQEAFSPPAFMVRRSMPWGDVERHGLQFIAFASRVATFEAVLRRMLGADDGVADALLRFTRAETGGFYWCPPLRDGRVDLSALGPPRRSNA